MPQLEEMSGKTLHEMIPPDWMVINWLKARDGALKGHIVGLDYVTVDGERVNQVTACSITEGWCTHYDDPPVVENYEVRERVKFGKVELVMRKSDVKA